MSKPSDRGHSPVRRRAVIGGAIAAAASISDVRRMAMAAAGSRMVKTVSVHAPGGMDNLRVSQVETRPPGPGEITVRLRASSLNYHDYIMVRNWSKPRPLIPLSDGAGEVVDVGANVTTFKRGDNVISMFYPTWDDDSNIPEGFSTVPGDGIDGFAREMVTMPAHAFTLAPNNLSHREAATLSCAGVTAWRALMTDGGLKPGATVLTLGTGGVSVFAVQFAKMMGAKVISTTSSDAKAARLKALGASEVINYRTTPEWGKIVREMTNGVGVDHIIETGGKGTWPQSIIAARNYGHIAYIGVVAGGHAAVPGAAILVKRLRIIGVAVANRQDQMAMVKTIEQKGNFKPVLDKDFALEQLGDAFRYEESGAHFGKITVSI